MLVTESSYDYDHFIALRNTIRFRGKAMITFGTILAILSGVEPQVHIMYRSSWLPLVAMILLLVGILQCFDAYLSRKSKDFLFYLLMAVFDTVIAVFLLFALDQDAAKISLLVAAYLVTKGIFRIFAFITLARATLTKPAIFTSFISVCLGLLLWNAWPFSMQAWFIAFCLSVEIVLRGLALTGFANWLESLAKSREKSSV